MMCSEWRGRNATPLVWLIRGVGALLSPGRAVASSVWTGPDENARRSRPRHTREIMKNGKANSTRDRLCVKAARKM